MEKLKMHTPDGVNANIERIAELFPTCVTESRDDAGKVTRAIDFDLLRQELSDRIVEGPQERYRLDWPGKREALLAANAPIAKTLRPCREESVDFETTRNLFIEGDNLDALKLLQETYLGKVKMIYIDPPYNTGNDFIYEDDFAEDASDYLARSNQTGEEGRLVANPDSNGRFHSDWLDMLYSRLRLARSLMSDDGVLVASIDDNEVANLKKLCEEVFGEDNLLFQITVLCNPKGRSQDKYVANCHEYLLGYSKHALEKGAVNVPKDENEIEENYRLLDRRGRYRELELRNTHREFGRHNRKNLYYPFFVGSGGEVSLEKAPGTVAVYPNWDDGFEGCWTWGADKARQQFAEIVAKRVGSNWKIYRKNYAEGEDGKATKQVKSIWVDRQFHTEKGQAVFNELFESRGKIFQSPKSVGTIAQLLRMGSGRNSVVLDFFAGSSTTAHAVMGLNAEDGGDRRFIVVQWPEPCANDSEAHKAGYESIAEVSKERIRRAGAKIKTDNAGKEGIDKLDVGFRVLKIDTSNMAEVYYRPDELKQDDLLGQVDNVKPDRTAEDLLFQVLLDCGVDLSLPIVRETIYPQMTPISADGEPKKNLRESAQSADKKGLEVFFVNGNALAACFVADGSVDEAFVKELAKRKPLRVVFRDKGFVSDNARINVEQIFKTLSPDTEVRTL